MQPSLEQVFGMDSWWIFSRGTVILRAYTRNHPSAMESIEVVAEHIRTECRAGQIVGPLSPVSGEFM